jgi:hypothetical protein
MVESAIEADVDNVWLFESIVIRLLSNIDFAQKEYCLPTLPSLPGPRAGNPKRRLPTGQKRGISKPSRTQPRARHGGPPTRHLSEAVSLAQVVVLDKEVVHFNTLMWMWKAHNERAHLVLGSGSVDMWLEFARGTGIDLNHGK